MSSLSKADQTDPDLEETEEDLIDDETPEPPFEPDFDQKVEIRQWALLQAQSYWESRVEHEIEMEVADPTEFPQHIITILDTAKYIEEYLMGKFTGEERS